MEQCIMCPKTSRVERRGVYGTNGGQGTVGTCLNVGSNIIEGRFRLITGAGGEKEGDQQKGYEGSTTVDHLCMDIGFLLTKITINC